MVAVLVIVFNDTSKEVPTHAFCCMRNISEEILCTSTSDCFC